MTDDPSLIIDISKTFDSGLYVVATPIGNLSDISARAVKILQAAEVIAVEDSRVTGKLLNHLGIKKRMVPYHDHSKAADRDRLIEAARHSVVALVSDAGTPLISDPGYKLVRSARQVGVSVFPVPGANAAIAALSASGLPTDRFLFSGFLPTKSKARYETLVELGAVRATLVFYESGPRLLASLSAISEIMGEREIVIAREISKRFEEFVVGSAQELAARYADAAPKGEIVLMIGPPVDKSEFEKGDIDRALTEALARLPAGKAAAEIAKRFGLDRQEVFAMANALKAKA